MYERLDDRMSSCDVAKYPVEAALVDPELARAAQVRNPAKGQSGGLLY